MHNKEQQPSAIPGIKLSCLVYGLIGGIPIIGGMIYNHVNGVDRLVNPLKSLNQDNRTSEQKYFDSLKRTPTPTPTATPEVQSFNFNVKKNFTEANTKNQNDAMKVLSKINRG